jgi:hypothetical protein
MLLRAHGIRPGGPLGVAIAAGYCFIAARMYCFARLTLADSPNLSDFRAQGMLIGSAIIEGGCKTVTGSRLKQFGMFWTIPGANRIIALRCCRVSGKFEDFWGAGSPAACPAVTLETRTRGTRHVKGARYAGSTKTAVP